MSVTPVSLSIHTARPESPAPEESSIADRTADACQIALSSQFVITEAVCGRNTGSAYPFMTRRDWRSFACTSQANHTAIRAKQEFIMAGVARVFFGRINANPSYLYLDPSDQLALGRTTRTHHEVFAREFPGITEHCIRDQAQSLWNVSQERMQPGQVDRNREFAIHFIRALRALMREETAHLHLNGSEFVKLLAKFTESDHSGHLGGRLMAPVSESPEQFGRLLQRLLALPYFTTMNEVTMDELMTRLSNFSSGDELIQGVVLHELFISYESSEKRLRLLSAEKASQRLFEPNAQRFSKPTNRNHSVFKSADPSMLFNTLFKALKFNGIGAGIVNSEVIYNAFREVMEHLMLNEVAIEDPLHEAFRMTNLERGVFNNMAPEEQEIVKKMFGVQPEGLARLDSVGWSIGAIIFCLVQSGMFTLRASGPCEPPRYVPQDEEKE